MEVEIVKWSDSDYGIYDLNGMCVECDFGSYEEAEKYIEDNGYINKDSF